jgi:hypothetical protein
MNLNEFYKALEQHDWFYPWTDDSSVYWRGEQAWQVLETTAKENGQAYAWLLAEYARHMCSGEAWNTPKHPKPEVPVTLDLKASIDLRAAYEKLVFSADPEAERQRLLVLIHTNGALAAAGEQLPFLLNTIEPFIQAWAEGQAAAAFAYTKLKDRNV